MGNDLTPYITRNAGDLLSAGDWNAMQVDIKQDIADQIEKAVGNVDNVPHAGDADKLDGKTLEDITKDITQKVLEIIGKQAGKYQRIFKRLELCKERIITHGLNSCPLVDIYQLDYFMAVCAKGETPGEEVPELVNFYLYHATEKKIRIPAAGLTKPITIEIEPTDGPLSRVKFSDLLTLYGVSYTDTTDLEELEASFWAAFFESPPNDEFDPEQYCHSPWFEKCCGERRTVKELKDRQDWDRIYLKWMPRKTINLFPATPPQAPAKGNATFPKGTDVPFTTTCPLGGTNNKQTTEAPTQVQVIHYDLDTIGIKLIDYPVYPDDQINGTADNPVKLPPDFLTELKVMVLLKA
jgi:hypothetical protein